MSLLTSLFGVPTYRWFNTVDKVEELKELMSNPFLKPYDIIYCKEDKTYYSYEERIIPDDEFDSEYQSGTLIGFYPLSVGEQNRETVQFFHKLNIGDTFNITDKDGTEHKCTIINITYSLLLKDLSYTFVMEDKKEVPYTQLVAQVDAKLLEGRAMQSLIFENDF